MLFFDTNSLLIHLELKKEINKLEKTQEFLQREIEKDKKIIEKPEEKAFQMLRKIRANFIKALKEESLC
jgi:cell division protein FtsB